MAERMDGPENGGRAPLKTGNRKKLSLKLIGLALLPVVAVTVWIIVMLGRTAVQDVKSYEKQLDIADTSPDNVVLPAHDKNDFISEIPVYGAQRLCVWKNSKGNDCLAVQTMDFGMSMNQRVVLFDEKLGKMATVHFKQGGMSGMSGGFAVGDVDGDGSPEVFMSGSNTLNSSTVAGYDSTTGKRFLKESFNMDMAPSLYLVDTLGGFTGSELLVFNPFTGWDGQKYYVLTLPQGTRNSAHEQSFETNTLAGPGHTEGPAFCDWDGDGKQDTIFFGEGSNAYIHEEGSKIYSRIVPYVKGAFLNPVDLTLEQNGIGAKAVARYVSPDGEVYSVLAYYESHMDMPDFLGENTDEKAKPEDESDVLEWIVEGSAGVVSQQKKTFKSTGNSGDNNLCITDVTGDGIPEICVLVEENKLAIYDTGGKELFSKILFSEPTMRGLGADWLLTGDFDGDKLSDLAFIYKDGLFIPKLDSLRTKPQSSGAETPAS